MNVLDLFLVGAIVLAAISGYRSGALPQIFAWLGVALFVVGAFLLVPLASPALEDLEPLIRGLVVLGIFGFAFVLGQGIGGSVGRRFRDQLGRGVLGNLDQAAGALVGAAEGILVIWLASSVITAIPHQGLQAQVRDSAVLQAVQERLPSSAVITSRIERSWTSPACRACSSAARRRQGRARFPRRRVPAPSRSRGPASPARWRS